MEIDSCKALAYIIGVALGDGNLSNPNGRAFRLRITCDTRYPAIIANSCEAIKKCLPENKVSIIYRAKTYIDISSYSNQWARWLPWKAGTPKNTQPLIVPAWIKKENSCLRACLRGLIETLGFSPTIYKIITPHMPKYIVRVARNAKMLVKKLDIHKEKMD